MTLEQNIERIADALEGIRKALQDRESGKQETAPGAAVPAPAAQIPVAPAAGSHGTVPVAGQQGASQWPDYSKNPAPINTQPWLPPQMAGAPAAAPVQVPTTAAPQQYTFDQLAVATANLSASGKDVFQILGRFGVGMLMDLPQEKFGEYAAALREAGAVI